MPSPSLPVRMASDKAPSSARAFNSMPIEINQAIALCLDSDKDLAAFRLICRSTYYAIDADNLTFWRVAFKSKYDFVDGTPNPVLRTRYEQRAKLLRIGVHLDFFHGHHYVEGLVVKALRSLILDSHSERANANQHRDVISKNQCHLKEFVLNSRLLNHTRRGPEFGGGEPLQIKEQLAVVKILCYHFVFLLPEMPHRVYGFDVSQSVVYQRPNATPLFSSNYMRINWTWFMHQLNFFRYHLMSKENPALHAAFNALKAHEKPQLWHEPIKEGIHPLAKSWKGTHAHLDMHDLQVLRKKGPGCRVFIDGGVDRGKIETFKFTSPGGPNDPNSPQLPWPAIFENALGSLVPWQLFVNRANLLPSFPALADPGAAAAAAAVRSHHFNNSYMQFETVGRGNQNSKIIGWVNSFPPQSGVPGWKRITFMKHFIDDYVNMGGGHHNLWAYEGIVLPGDRIILGRWWLASPPQHELLIDYCGPFIMWAVDDDPAQ